MNNIYDRFHNYTGVVATELGSNLQTMKQFLHLEIFLLEKDIDSRKKQIEQLNSLVAAIDKKARNVSAKRRSNFLYCDRFEKYADEVDDCEFLEFGCKDCDFSYMKKDGI